MSRIGFIKDIWRIGKYIFNAESYQFLSPRSQITKEDLMPWYAVKRGQNPGVYTTWEECQKMVKGFPNATFKKFTTKLEAEAFLNDKDSIINKRKSILNYSKYKKIKVSKINFDETNQLLNDKELQELAKENKIPKSNRSPQKFVDVYVDGCCFSNGQDGARAGIGVFWGPQNAHNISEPLYISHPSKLTDTAKLEINVNSEDDMVPYDKPTNNLAEIKAAHLAILQAKERSITNLAIHSDSELLINSITKWLPKWEMSGWKASTGKPVKNSEELKALYKDLKSGITIKWVHVRGHSGVPGNEAADALAKRGAEMAPKS